MNMSTGNVVPSTLRAQKVYANITVNILPHKYFLSCELGKESAAMLMSSNKCPYRKAAATLAR